LEALMTAKPTHWLYPIHRGTGHYFEGKDGKPILDPVTEDYDTSTDAFWASVRVNTSEAFYLSRGFRLMQPDDLIWIYAGSPDQSIVGLGRASRIDLNRKDDFWYVDIVWDQNACAALERAPIPRTLFGDIPQTAAVRASDKAKKVLEGWLKQEGFATRVQPADDELVQLDEDDARLRVIGEVVRRQGQPRFRDELMRAYGHKCAISGCDVPEVLEAAHIRSYNGPGTNVVPNGLLLRSDLHALFDLHLLEVDKDYRVMLDATLRQGVYKKFHGKALQMPKAKDAWPSKKLLREHRKKP
jgi:hypothetical protein